MNAITPRRNFIAADANDARAEGTLPLLIGLMGPSGSGKTYSALRIAKGIQSVVGGDIFVVDTEQRRSLHYTEDFSFKHINFGAPFGSLDYLDALRACKAQGAGVAIVDSCSHEHDGPGGLLEQHDAELTRMAGDDFRKRDAMMMLAWQKPKAARRKLIAALTTELQMPVIFCFRAKNTTKPMKVDGKMKPVDMGFTSIGADEWIFEMALSALLLPGSNGVPTWHSDKPGEELAIKLPKQFRSIADNGRPLDEKVGAMLAQWATVGARAATKAAPARFDAETGEVVDTARVKAETWATDTITKIADAEDSAFLIEVERGFQKALAKAKREHPDLASQVDAAFAARLAAFDEGDGE